MKTVVEFTTPNGSNYGWQTVRVKMDYMGVADHSVLVGVKDGSIILHYTYKELLYMHGLDSSVQIIRKEHPYFKYYNTDTDDSVLVMSVIDKYTKMLHGHVKLISLDGLPSNYYYNPDIFRILPDGFRVMRSSIYSQLSGFIYSDIVSAVLDGKVFMGNRVDVSGKVQGAVYELDSYAFKCIARMQMVRGAV